MKELQLLIFYQNSQVLAECLMGGDETSRELILEGCKLRNINIGPAIKIVAERTEAMLRCFTGRGTVSSRSLRIPLRLSYESGGSLE